MVFDLACRTAEKLGCPGVVQRSDVMANTDYVGEGYGLPTQSGLEAIKMFAELEGILLDPCYSAKGAAGLIDLARKGAFAGERIMFCIPEVRPHATHGILPPDEASACQTEPMR